jgi:hypothetical protein
MLGRACKAKKWRDHQLLTGTLDLYRMPSSGMLLRVALVRTTRAKQRNVPQDGIFHSHRRESLKSYITLTGWTL